MNNLDRNWNNLFGEYTTDEAAWHGQWTVYSSNQEVSQSKRVIRSFRSNLDNTIITHTNRYIDTEGNIVDEKTWQIDRETCNLPDGVVHPAMPWMKTLSFGTVATAWISSKFIPGKPFGAELFFREDHWRTSAAIVYGENGQLDRIVHIREHLGCFSDELPSLKPLNILENWVGEKRSMSADLSVSPEESMQISFEQLGDNHKIIPLPGDIVLILPEFVEVDLPIYIAAAQQMPNRQLSYLEANYNTDGAFTLLTFATLRKQV